MSRYYVRKSTRGKILQFRKFKQSFGRFTGRSVISQCPKEVCHTTSNTSETYERHCPRFRTILCEEMETQIVHHAIDMQQRFYGLTPCDIRKLAFQLVEMKKLPQPFNSIKQMAENKWLLGFLQCNPELS